jgi:predicted AlkP superfamily pyrophosphatase or phosphodiesterase
MRRLSVLLLLAASLFGAAPNKPKLVLLVVFDQFRYDYLTRFRSEYTAGFDQMLTKGAVFTDARLVHFPTVTAVGHSTFLTGATPSVSGIVGNDWWDREENRAVTSVSDSNTQLLGAAAGAGSSPRRLLADTIGDELKMASGGKSRVIGISIKDRAAILPSGHMADGAYWFDAKTGNFVSSTYYFSKLPSWAAEFNSARPAEKYKGATWLDHKLPDGGPELYSALDASPFGNDMLEEFAERALTAEQLGKDEFTDVLSVSFSSNDYVGHDNGPFSPEEHEVSVRSDKALLRLFQAIDKQVGMNNVVVVLSADHGVAPAPGRNALKGMPGGRINGTAVREVAQSALVAKYGEGNWILGSWDLSMYLNRDLISLKNLDGAEVRRLVAEAVGRMAHIQRVYTRDQLASGQVLGDEISARVMRGFHARRAPDIQFIPEPYWVVTTGATTHGTPYSYDNHVPVIFMGPGVKPGRYHRPVAVNDIAPTLATMLDVETPSGSTGRVLDEMLTQ